MKWWGWILSLLPAGIGVLIYFLAANGMISDPVLYLRGNLAALAIRLGLIISIIIVALALAWIQIRKINQRKIQKVHKQADEDRRRFLQRLDHELKNPLTAVQAGLSNLTFEPLEDQLEEELSAVKAQVLRISRLIADLRKLSTLETTVLEPLSVNLADLLTDVVSVLHEQAKTEDRKLTLNLPKAPWPLPEIMGDPDLLILAFHNLLDNAIKFTSAGDMIEVRAFEDNNDVVIEIADTGLGIPREEINRVWDELYRGEKARAVSGSGLGLSLVRAIIEKHGGKVGLRSKQDQGSVFSIHLPLS